jgi:xanthine dehydrogenase accessory factor
MDELDAILKTWRSLSGANRDAVLATVVHVTGSAYRRPGARMLIVPDGRQIGCVSGGCLEGEIVKRAWWFTSSEAPVVRTYDTTSDDDAVWEFGLGCNGVVHVLLERVNTTAASQMLRFLETHRSSHRTCIVVTVVRASESADVRTGDRWLVDEVSVERTMMNDSRWDTDILAHAAAVMAEKKSRLVHLGAIDVFVEWVGPPISLVVFGAGHDAIPLVTIAAELGCRVTVADGRPAYAKAERFPRADRVIVMNRENPLKEIPIDRESAVVMMTHNFPMDVRLMPIVLAAGPRYLGLLGPRTRAEKLFRELNCSMPEFVHAPAGLDTGSDSPAAIALSIAAEIQAVISGRTGAMLKYRIASIHAPAAELGKSDVSDRTEAVRPAYCETIVGSNV